MFEAIPTDNILKERTEKNLKLHIPSRFKFLNAIFGLRPDGIHGLLATTGAGKSTLVRSIIADTTEAVKTLLILSEETPETYFTGFNKQGEVIRRDQIEVVLEKTIASMSENADERFAFLFDLILKSDCRFIFWDNVTASRLLGDSLNISKKGDYFAKIIDFLKENGIGLFYIIHTDKSIGKNQVQIFSGNNTRGSDAVRIVTEYFFVMQGWTIKNRTHNFITIEKHREHTVKEKFYLLQYKNETYKSDIVSSLEEITMASRYTADAVKLIKKQFEAKE